jgi:hypothetical protein
LLTTGLAVKSADGGRNNLYCAMVLSTSIIGALTQAQGHHQQLLMC